MDAMDRFVMPLSDALPAPGRCESCGATVTPDGVDAHPPERVDGEALRQLAHLAACNPSQALVMLLKTADADLSVRAIADVLGMTPSGVGHAMGEAIKRWPALAPVLAGSHAAAVAGQRARRAENKREYVKAHRAEYRQYLRNFRLAQKMKRQAA